MTVQKITVKPKKRRKATKKNHRSWWITFYSYLHSIWNKATLHKRQQMHWRPRPKRPGQFQGNTIASNVHLQTCFCFPGERLISHTQACTQSIPRVQKSTCCLFWSYPFAYKSPEKFPSCFGQSLHLLWLFFPLKISSFTAAGIPNYNPLGKWMLWSAHSLVNALSLHHLMTYISIILTGAESDILEFLSQTGLDLGITGISVPQPQNRKTCYRTYYHRNHILLDL